MNRGRGVREFQNYNKCWGGVGIDGVENYRKCNEQGFECLKLKITFYIK